MIRTILKKNRGYLENNRSTKDAGLSATGGIFLEFSSFGDANGLFYLLGTDFLSTSWTNPHTSSRIFIQGYGGGWPGSPAAQYCNRDTEYFYLGVSNPVTNNYIAVDIDRNNQGRVFRTDFYIQRNYSTPDRFVRNWKLQGANGNINNIYTDANWKGLAWVDLDVRTNNTNMCCGQSQWGGWAVNQPAASQYYRYLRIVQTGPDSLGENYLCTTEVEFYGMLLF